MECAKAGGLERCESAGWLSFSNLAPSQALQSFTLHCIHPIHIQWHLSEQCTFYPFSYLDPACCVCIHADWARYWRALTNTGLHLAGRTAFDNAVLCRSMYCKALIELEHHANSNHMLTAVEVSLVCRLLIPSLSVEAMSLS